MEDESLEDRSKSLSNDIKLALAKSKIDEDQAVSKILDTQNISTMGFNNCLFYLRY